MQVKSYRRKDGTKVRGYAIYSKDRRTPILVDGRLSKSQAIKKALSIKKRGSNEIDLVRRLTESEQRLADKGKWVSGHSVDKERKNLRGVGPKPKSFSLFSNLLKFAKPYKPLNKETLRDLLKAGKNGTKQNRANFDLFDFLNFSKQVYSNPGLRERIKDQVMSSSQGGKPGQWSAIKSNILAKKYKEAGGGYSDNKGKEQKSLDKWNKESWSYSNGKKSGGKGRFRPKAVWDKLTSKEKKSLNESKYRGNKQGKQFVPIPSKLRDKVQPKEANFSINHHGEIFSGVNKPKRTPSHPTKSHAVLVKNGSKKKIVRFGQQGVVGSPKKKGESKAYANRRKSFKARHSKNIQKGKTSAAYWADKFKW